MRFDARRLLSARRPLIVAAAAGLLTAGVVGAVAAADGDDGAPTADPTATTSAPPASPTQPTTSLAQAVDSALKAVPGKVEEAELEDEHGRTVWELDVIPDSGTPRKVHVDARSGKITANRADRPDDDDDPVGALRGAKITIAHAAGAAEKAVSGRATSVEFEYEHGRALWVADVTGRDGTPYEIAVDAATGAVVAKETDRD